MKILVTGGAGFIGSNLVEELTRDGEHEVFVLDNFSLGSMQNLRKAKPSKIIKASSSDIPHLNLTPPEVIFHLGIPSSSPMYKKEPFLVGSAISDAIKVFELAKETHAKVIFASSSSIYNGLQPPHSEDMEPKVTDFYTEARICIERLSFLYKNLYDVESVGCRFFSIYGPNEEAKGIYANIISQFLWAMKKRESPVIYGDGSQTRDFIYVKDVVSLCMKAMLSSHEGLFNVGTGVSHSFNDIVALLNDALNTKIEPIYRENPIKKYVEHTKADVSKTRSIFGWTAKYSLEEGIEELIALSTKK